MSLGHIVPRVLHNYCFLCLCCAANVFAVETPIFDLDKLSTRFGKFTVHDPQDQTWSLVESGVQIKYRDFICDAEALRYLNTLLEHYSKPLIAQALFTSIDDGFVSIDSRHYADQSFPLRGLIHARQVTLKSTLFFKTLTYDVGINELKHAKGRMRFRGNHLCPFYLSAPKMTARVDLLCADEVLGEPVLRQLLLSGPATMCYQQDAQTGLSCRAEQIELSLSADGFVDAIRLTGEPAQLEHYQAGLCRSYSGSSLQVQLGTAGTIQRLQSSSDLSFRNRTAKMELEACAAPLAE